MDKKSKGGVFNIDVKSLSPANLLAVIQELKGSDFPELLLAVKKELVNRLKREGLNNQKIAKILTANVYGVLKRKTIAKEWAEALGVSKKEFLKFIGID